MASEPVSATTTGEPPTVRRPGSINDLAFLIDCYREHGPIFKIPQKGPEARKEGDEFTILAGTEANLFTMKAASMHQDENIKLRSDNHWEDFSSELGMKEFTREGSQHKQHRTLTSHGYARTTVTDRLGEMVEIAQAEMSTWRPGESVPMLPSFQRIISEQLGRFMIGFSARDYLEDLVKFVHLTKVTMLLRTRGMQALSDPDYIRARERVFELGRKAIAARLRLPVEQRPKDLLDDLLSVADPQIDDELPPLLIAATIGPFLAGLETASYRSAFMLDLLLADHGARDRVRAEIGDWFTGPLTWERLKTCAALSGVMMEALRLYPGPARQWYTAVEPFTFKGCRVDKDDSVVVVYDIPHHLGEIFPRPREFDVDRYRAPRNEHRIPGAFAPFGVGGHTCLGSGIAEVQLMVNVAAILHDFDMVAGPRNRPFDADADADAALDLTVADRRRPARPRPVSAEGSRR